MTQENVPTTGVADGGALRVLDSGLVIVRREKHEWRDALAKLTEEKLSQRTGKAWGSKFTAAWTRERVTAWIARQVATAGWTTDLQEPMPLDVRFDEVVGLADGQRVHTIRIVCDGRYIHAYPIGDAHE